MPLFLLLLSVAGAEQATQPTEMPTMTEPALLCAHRILTVDGSLDQAEGSSPDEGVLTVRIEVLYQTIGWEPPSGELLAAALHERGLVYQALRQPLPADAPAPTEVPVAGTTGLRWQVDGGSTHFVGTSWHCPGHRMELTTYGPDAALVSKVHMASLDGSRCVVGGLGTSSP
jgi:hypothetical protein